MLNTTMLNSILSLNYVDNNSNIFSNIFSFTLLIFICALIIVITILTIYMLFTTNLVQIFNYITSIGIADVRPHAKGKSKNGGYNDGYTNGAPGWWDPALPSPAPTPTNTPVPSPDTTPQNSPKPKKPQPGSGSGSSSGSNKRLIS